MQTEKFSVTIQPCGIMRFSATHANTILTLMSSNKDVNEFMLNVTDCCIFSWINCCSVRRHYSKYKQVTAPLITNTLIHKHTVHANMKGICKHPSTTHTTVDIHKKEHQTATGIVTRWSKALTTIMRVDHIAFVKRGWISLSLLNSTFIKISPCSPAVCNATTSHWGSG